MTIIKKKDIKSYNTLTESKKELDELVDADGSPIEGDRNAVNDTEIEVPQGQTTDDFVQSTRRGGFNQRGYGGPISPIGGRYESETKEGDLTENMGDLNNNGTSDIEDLSKEFSKPITAGKTQELIDSISKNNLNGEELGMILNHLITNINIQSIPQSYIAKIKSNL